MIVSWGVFACDQAVVVVWLGLLFKCSSRTDEGMGGGGDEKQTNCGRYKGIGLKGALM